MKKSNDQVKYSTTFYFCIKLSHLWDSMKFIIMNSVACFSVGLFILVLITTASCQTAISTLADVEVGEIPQEVEDIYVESPEGVKIEVWQSGLEIPWSLVFLPDGNALVSERPGKILFIEQNEIQEEPYYIVSNVDHRLGSESGLMGLALHPDFENHPFVYAMFTYREGNVYDNRVIRLKYEVKKGTFDRTILKGIPAGSNHDGGRIRFGPDGMLYILTGETFERELAQKMESLGGKILRVTPEGDIPSDNPFKGSAIYTLGHRNPQGLDWHPDTGDLFSSEHGPSGEMMLRGKDIINVIHKGKNYGWPRVIGEVNDENYDDPLIMWENATPPSGIAFWNNDLYVTTLRSEALIRISMNYRNEEYEITRIERWFSPSRNRGTYGRMREAVVGPDGALYVLTSNRDGRGNPDASDDRILRISLTK
jgi:quinoprotein glucose dehydrogenase